MGEKSRRGMAWKKKGGSAKGMSGELKKVESPEPAWDEISFKNKNQGLKRIIPRRQRRRKAPFVRRSEDHAVAAHGQGGGGRSSNWRLGHCEGPLNGRKREDTRSFC